jgi:hypothetical protein
MNPEPIVVNCVDRERILLDGSERERRALEEHAQLCAVCAEEVRAWQALSAAARQLRDYSDAGTLWPKIERALSAGARPAAQSRSWAWLRLSAQSAAFTWQTALAGALVLLLTIGGALVLVHRRPGGVPGPLLKDPALAEVERTEKAYQDAIEKLAAETRPDLETPATPLMASYHEKLLVIDSAIDDLRAQAGMNPSNAHLRRQLLAMYQEKQQTLEDVLEAKAK